jgi:hypothetical protein
MEIRLSNPTLVPDLMEFLRRAAGISLKTECQGATLHVEAPSTIDSDRARRHLVLYVAAWEGLHPGVHVSTRDA